MSLNDIDIGAALETKSPVQLQKINDELFNMQARIKRAYDRGLNKDDAAVAQAFLNACQAAQEGVDALLKSAN